MEITLNNPFYLYPGFPCSGYFDQKQYISQLFALRNFLLELDSSDFSNTLVHMTIGSAAEEEYNSLRSDIKHQWKQLFPDHLMDYIMEYPDNRITGIIVSPDRTFKIGEHFRDPLFIAQTNDILVWELDQTDHVIYKCVNYNMEIHIFNTMMPTVQEKNNEIIDSFKRTLSSETELLNKYVQTIEDKLFVTYFYGILDELVSKIKTMTIFSFAVFNNRTDKSSNNNYKMFEEIKTLSNIKNNKKLILAEWEYDIHNYNLKVIGKLEFITYASIFKAVIGKIKPKIIHIKEDNIELF
jgi:hypothetical protein